jgi:hypothetical protein
MLNIKQIEAREAQLKTEALGLMARIAETKSASPGKLGPVLKEYEAWDAEAAFLREERNRLAAAEAHPAAAYGGDIGKEPIVTTKAVSRVASPLNIPQAEYRGLYEAAVRRTSYRIDTAHAGVSTKAPFGEGNFT